MRIAKVFAVGTAAALLSSQMALAAVNQMPVHEEPTNMAQVKTVCTGVQDRNDPVWNRYSVKFVFADPGGEVVAPKHITVMPKNAAANNILDMDCGAPWLLMNLPAGDYSAAAAIPGSLVTANFTTTGEGQAVITFTLPPVVETGTPQALASTR